MAMSAFSLSLPSPALSLYRELRPHQAMVMPSYHIWYAQILAAGNALHDVHLAVGA